MSTVELGDAVGMSGPALYNYFPSKDALLAELLVDASRRLLDGLGEILEEGAEPVEALPRLIAFHLDFATSDPDIIRIQDRELAQLPDEVSAAVRGLQRRYVQGWDGVLARVAPELGEAERQTRLLAVFGLLNSTPFSAKPTGEAAGGILAGMALRALVGTPWVNAQPTASPRAIL